MSVMRRSRSNRESYMTAWGLLLVTSAAVLLLPADDPSFLRIFGIAGVFVSLAAMLTALRSFQRWLDGDRFSQELEHGKEYLAAGEFMAAALAFQRAAVYQKSWRAHFGLAYALEGLGHLEDAVSEYREARFIGYESGKDVLAVTTNQYVRALLCLETVEAKEIALRAADAALVDLTGESSTEVDQIRLGRAYVLISLRRDAEAQSQFEEIACSACDEEMKRTAQFGATAAGLIELAKQGPETFFAMITKNNDKVH